MPLIKSNENEEKNDLKEFFKMIKELKEKLFKKLFQNSYIKKKEPNKSNKINNNIVKIVTLTIIIIVIIIIIATTLFIKLIYPNNCINIIDTNYSLQQYDEVSKYNSKLDMIKSYLNNNKEKYIDIQYKVKLSNSIVLCNNQEFEKALKELLDIELQDETIKNKINDCKYELGKIYIEKCKYDDSLRYLQEVQNKNDTPDLIDKIHYNLSLKYLEGKKYSNALEELSKIQNKEYENLKTTKQKIHYEYGKYFFSMNDYNGGISQLELAKDYEDANTLVNNAYIAKAEKLIKEEKLIEAKQIYDYIPSETEYNGIKASNRKNQLNKIANIINSTGKKYATKSYCESRNVWKYDGRWENWYIDTPDSSEYINTSLKLNDDGTFDLNGTVYFYAFNDFSSLQKYCNAKIISRTINIKNINSIPPTYNIDENTKLLYSKGVFSIKYSKKDDYSTNFYNLYNSSVTF